MHAPPRQLGPMSYLLYSSVCELSREDTGLSLAESVFEAPTVLPNEKCDEFAVDSIIKNFQTTLDTPVFSLPRHNSSPSLPSKLPAELLSAHLFWIHRGSTVQPLQPLYDGPYAVIRRGGRSFTLKVGSREEIIAVSRLKACTAADAAPGNARCRGQMPRQLHRRPAGIVCAVLLQNFPRQNVPAQKRPYYKRSHYIRSHL
jgi:hypothetical protein